MTTATRRERLREATLHEIAEAARGQLRAVGASGLTLSAVAREVGMSAPALYRYVDGIDGLLTLLIAQGYASLVAEVQEATAAVPADDPGGRFVALAMALRTWAVRDVAQYGLIFGTPLPGYAAPEDGPTTQGARSAGDALWQVLVDAQAAGRLGEPVLDRVDPEAVPVLQAKAGSLAGQLPDRVQAAGWAALALLLGAVALDVFGHMPPCDEPVRLELYRGQVQAARCLVGLPAPAA
jgi:AcrR family transcriptional regulator